MRLRDEFGVPLHNIQTSNAGALSGFHRILGVLIPTNDDSSIFASAARAVGRSWKVS